MNLKQEWSRVALNCCMSENSILEVFSEIENHYTIPLRFYHNLNHISKMLEYWDLLFHKLKEPFLVALAIWFHDIVYDVTRCDNEYQSAILAADVLKTHSRLSNSSIDFVSRLILSTKNHFLLDNNRDSDLNYFLDFDLQILGAPSIEYCTYKQQVRQEFKIYTDLQYFKARLKFLENIIALKSIYYTDDFKKLFQAQAKENIRYEILDLKLKLREL